MEASPEAQRSDFGFVGQHAFSDGNKRRIQSRPGGDFDRSLGSVQRLSRSPRED